MQFPKTENRITTGNWITLIAFLVTGAVAWGNVTSNLDALAQRVGVSEKKDEKTSETIGTIKEKLIEIQAEQKSMKADTERQTKQLDRIERSLESVAKRSEGKDRPTP